MKMAEETRASGPLMAENGDMTGTEPLQGTRHMAAETGAGLVDQDENLKEAEENGGRSPQADYGTRNDPRREAKDAGASPENKSATAAPARKTPAKRR
jgi:hypothetical protein